MRSRHGIKFLLIILLLLLFRVSSFAAEWQGIIPGVSTRSDVVRSFQRCADHSLPCAFDLDGDQIRIVFSGMVQNYFYQCAERLPAETVLVVEVTPRRPIALQNLLRSHNLRKLGTVSKISGYIDEGSGLILKSLKHQVIQLNYVAARADRRRCEDYYADPAQFVRVTTHCPPITLEGSTQVATDGDVVRFQANVQPDPKMTLIWTVSAGRIITQSGRQMALDTTGLRGKSVIVTLQALGACSVENSLTINNIR